ncbi:MAG: glycoside hydrolase family 3 N-terminal domain-containing protein [Bdellovibrionales bacterium]
MSNPEASSHRRPLPVVFSCSGESLTSPERRFFGETNPFGFILFQRNCNSRDQVRWLIKELRQVTGRQDVPILIDQEGGRVSRLQPPQWPTHPPARLFGIMYERDPEWGTEAMRLYARIVADELWQLGINVDCAPVLDLFMEGATSAIGDRAISRKPAVVAALARVWSETFLANGILPVIKHLPGHGRMSLDPHQLAVRIGATRAELESDDFVPFELLKDMPLGMNSHAVFTALDADAPASLSAKVTENVIRGSLGFDGLLFSDDLNMKALKGAPADLAQSALAAGADVALWCNGTLPEMGAIATALQPMSDSSWERWMHARGMTRWPKDDYTPEADSARLDMLLGASAFQVRVIT